MEPSHRAHRHEVEVENLEAGVLLQLYREYLFNCQLCVGSDFQQK